MIAIITEKPSVAQDISRVLGVYTKKDGYMTGNGYMITWAFGHLIGLGLPEDYGFQRPSASELPVLPDQFRLSIRKKKTDRGYVTDAGVSKQVRTIEKVFNECDSIIVAMDSGREGENIFRYIYNYLECNKPFMRLWINSMTDEAIKKGFNSLQDGNKYDNLFHAADCRAKADWAIGINASRALSIASGIANNSLGRVQTPTLAMICARYLENRAHKTVDYWQNSIALSKGESCQLFTSAEKIYDKDEANSVYEHLKTYPSAKILSCEKKKTNQQPPLLYDLTTLQKEANTYHDLTADQTLQVMQILYEKKLISYPRTASRYIPEDVFAGIKPLLKFIVRMKSFAHYTALIPSELNRRSVDDDKVIDHHAIIVTGIQPETLTKQEHAIYCMIAGKMLEAFSQKCEKEILFVRACCDTMEFESKISRILSAGWRNVFQRNEDKEEDENHKTTVFPEYSENELVPISGHNLIQKKTHPRPLFTEASLLGAMENAGKNLEDETQREAIKDCGIGTPATRAAIIETLFTRKYIERSGKSLVPTEKGLYIYNAVKDMRIADVSLTGDWEKSLLEMEKGNFNPETFMQAIKVLTGQITSEILSAKMVSQGGRSIVCPKCNIGKISFYNKVAKCNNEACKLIVFRQMLNKTLTEQHLEQLFSKGMTKLIKGFKGKKEKPSKPF